MAKARSCVACRARRVKCKREPEDDEAVDCQNCTKRNLRCLVAVEERRTVNNRRRLAGVEQALSNASNGNADGDLLRRLEAEWSDKSLLQMARVSAPADELQSHLIAFYFIGFHYGNAYSDRPFVAFPLVTWDTLESRFEAANRCVARLTEEDQLVCNIMAAVAACVADHPLLFLPSPHLPEPARCFSHPRYGEMSQSYGHARQAAVKLYCQRAQQLADASGLWRQPSHDNLARLLLLFILASRGNIGNGAARFYLIALVEQLRQLKLIVSHSPTYENETLGCILVVVLLDALSALANKTPLLVSEGETAIFLGTDLAQLSTWPSRISIEGIVADTSHPKRWHLVVVAYANVALNARILSTQRTTDDQTIDARLNMLTLLDASLAASEDTLLFIMIFARQTRTSRVQHWQTHFGVAVIANVMLRLSMIDLAECLQTSLAALDAFGLVAKLHSRMQYVLLMCMNSRPTGEEGTDAISFGTGSVWTLANLHRLAVTVTSWPLTATFGAAQKIFVLDRLIESTRKLAYCVDMEDTMEVLIRARQLLTLGTVQQFENSNSTDNPLAGVNDYISFPQGESEGVLFENGKDDPFFGNDVLQPDFQDVLWIDEPRLEF